VAFVSSFTYDNRLVTFDGHEKSTTKSEVPRVDAIASASVALLRNVE